MGFPAGMQLATVAFGIPLTVTGKEVVTHVAVKPTSRVIWAATGQPLPEFTDSFTAEAGQIGQFQVPFIDQGGFIDSAGNAVTDWAYQITASWSYGNERPITWAKNLKPLLGQTGPIDLDLVPDGPVSIPVTAPTAAVLGFNGRTGFITLQESDLPSRLSEAELSATYEPKGAAASATAPVSAAVVKSRRIATSQLVQGMLTAPVMATPPTFTYSSSLFPGYVAGATSATAGWPNNTAIRPSGAPLAPPNEFGATYPLGPDSQLTIFDGSVHYDFDCPDQTFVFRSQITSTGRFRMWVDGKPHAAAPVLLSTLAATSSSPGYIKVDLGSRATSRRVSVELEGVKPNATGTPLPFYGIWKESAGSVWPTSISSARMVVLGDSYGKGIGASVAADAYPIQLGRLLGITDVLHFTCVSSTGIMKGTTTNSYRTRLQKIIDAKPDIVLFQGSINDADAWPQFQGQIGPQFKLDVATLRAGLPDALIIVTSPLEVRVATSAELAVRDELKAAVAEEGLPFIDILGTTFFNGTGKSGFRTVTDGATTSGSTTITSATAAFNSGTDAGRIITGAGIPTGTTIASVTNSTTAVLSVAATASATGVSLTITAQKGDGNADYFVAATADDSSGAHPSSAGHLAIAKLLAGKIAPLIGATAA